MTAIEKLAKKLALEAINKNRAESSSALKPLRRIESLWWSLHKAEWLAKAKSVAKSDA